jgi:ribosomal protein L11 methylase PrmA
LKKGLLPHLFLHASSQRRHESSTKPAVTKQPKVSDFALRGLVDSLLRSVQALKPHGGETEWGDYYSFTNYSSAANKSKEKLVKSFLSKVPKPRMVWDVGANDGRFSRLALKRGAYVIAWDIDSKAVGINYRHRPSKDDTERMLPLLQDLVAPSPDVGWRLNERESLVARGPADVTLALALIHHLAIGRNVPLPEIANMFADISKYLIIEFVPKGDSKVEHLLASRPDIFPNYDIEHFEAAFKAHFRLVDKQKVSDSKRWLYLYKSNAEKRTKQA